MTRKVIECVIHDAVEYRWNLEGQSESNVNTETREIR